MTREEAIENLKGLLESNYVDSFEDEENESLRMAIQALEQNESAEEWYKLFVEKLEQESTDEWQNGYDRAWEEAKVFYEQEPCYDAISREDAEECRELMTDINGDTVYVVRMSYIRRLPPVTKEPKIWQFAEWVAREIFDDMWEYNKDAFAEIACRKLAKLGIVREKGNEWELVEPQESEESK